MVGLEQFALATPHRVAFVVGGVIPTQNVQYSVHDEKSHLVVERTGVRGRLVLGHFGADHHVTEEKGHIGRIGFGAIGSAARAGIDVDDCATIDRKRQNIGGARTRHVRDVQFGHVTSRDEEDTELTGTSNTFGFEDETSQRLPTFDVDGNVILFVGAEHFGSSVAAHSRATT